MLEQLSIYKRKYKNVQKHLFFISENKNIQNKTKYKISTVPTFEKATTKVNQSKQ